MSLPDAVRKPSLTGEPTTPFESEGAEPGSPVARVRVALVPRSGLQAVQEIQRLLRQRLRIYALIFLCTAALYGVYNVPAWIQGTALFGRLWFDWAYTSFFLAAAVVLVRILWSRRTLSLAWLRAMELVLFGLAIVFCALFIYIPTRLGALVKYDYLGEAGGWAVGSAVSLPAFAVLVAYGIFIPNTARRCAAVVGIMALIPLVAGAAGMALSEQAIDVDLRFAFFTNMTIWMATGAVLAVLGSHRISVLQQEALAARKLGQYQLKKRLGCGGMGEVYLAEHVLLRRPCAVKLIRPERAGDPRDLVRFEREVRTTATLSHPNTVQVFDYGHAEDGTFYYVMEYLPGLTLEQLVTQHGPLPPGRAIHFLRQLCGALREAHAVGLIHRDIKPSNVIVCQRGGVDDTAKLLDFGLVLPAAGGPESDKLTQEGAVTGTPSYMSPEQAGGQEHLDARSDIYSVGALAYFLLTGQPPFAGRSPVKILAAHLYEAPASLTQHRPDVPADLQAVVLRCLAKEPGDRYADAESFELALANCHAAGAWSPTQAAAWWRGQAGANGEFGSEGVGDERAAGTP
jgi:hypothetical protein